MIIRLLLVICRRVELTAGAYCWYGGLMDGKEEGPPGAASPSKEPRSILNLKEP